MNVNAVGPSDSADIRRAAIETAMINKEPSAQERAVETQRKILNRICGTENYGILRDALKPDDVAALFAQIKSQADRIAELEKDAKRLDWIQENTAIDFGYGTNSTVKFSLRPPGTLKLLRSLIDAAMNERKE